MLTINEKSCVFEEGESILDVARRNNLDIPTLCHLKDTSPTGACRICLVEIDGAKQLLPSCDTPARAGMVVKTHSPRVMAARKGILELLLASGDHHCILCNANGDCKLQDLSVEYRADSRSLPQSDIRSCVEDDNALILRDASKCIHCGRCVKACNEIQVNGVLSFGHENGRPKIFAGDNQTLRESDCVFCGECMQACPTGAMIERKNQFVGKIRDEQKVRTTCPYCGVGCQLWLHVRDQKIVKVTGVEEGLPNKGRTCVKGRFSYDFIYHKNRLTKPLIRQNDGGYKEAEWDEALNLIASKFGGFITESGPDSVAGVSCARSINEDNYAMQKLFRTVFKTNNIDHCART